MFMSGDFSDLKTDNGYSPAAKWPFFQSLQKQSTLGFMVEIDNTRREAPYAIC